MHFAFSALHVRPGLQSFVTSSHVPPESETVFSAHVALLPSSTHVALEPQEWPWQGWPTAEMGKHVPHAVEPPSGEVPLAAEQVPLWHCESVTQGLPAVNVPAVTMQELLVDVSSPHPSL